MRVDKGRAATYKPNPHDTIHESYSGFWIFRGKHVRRIPEGALIHASVGERLKRTQNRYKPKNLPKKYKLVT